MITPYTITNTAWIPITTAGQEGTCWLAEDSDDDEEKADIRITHTPSTPSDADLLTAKRVYRSSGNNDLFVISPDDISDVFYARANNSGDQAKLITDVS